MWALEYIIILTVPINTSMFKSEFLIYMNFIVDRFWKYIYLYLIALLMCRLIFLKFFASILGGYRNFIVWNFLLIFYFIVLAFFFFLTIISIIIIIFFCVIKSLLSGKYGNTCLQHSSILEEARSINQSTTRAHGDVCCSLIIILQPPTYNLIFFG